MSIALHKPSIFSSDHPAYPWIILTNVIVTTFLAILSAVATIISDDAIQGELALSDTLAIWVTTLYLLGVNTTVPTGNWFANHFGKKRTYTVGVLIFTFGSGLAAFSQNFIMIGCARLIEGVGAGMIFPVGLALIASAFSKEKLPLALILYIGIGFGGGFGLGAYLSGYLTEFHSWRDLFLLMIPFGLLAALSCWLSRKKLPEREIVPFDYWGYFFFVTFVATLLVGLTLAPIPATDEGWRSPLIIGCLVTAGICLVLAIYIESRHKNPIIPLPLFKSPIFAVSTMSMFLLGMSLFASVAVTAEYMIHGLFYEKYIVGKIAMAYGLTMALCSIIASGLMKILPIPVLIFSGLLMIISSYFWNNELNWLTGPAQIIPILIVRGAGLGFALGPTTVLALQDVPKELSSQAATLLTFFRQVGGTYAGTLIAIFTIKRKIFHAARWGEQANAQIPGYKVTHRKLFGQFYSDLSDKGLESTFQAKAEIIKNIEVQAFIQGQNDALFIFGCITSFVAFILFVFVIQRQMKLRKEISEIDSSALDD